MIRYLIRRLLQALLLLVAVSGLLFALMQAAPGDYLSEQRLAGHMSPEAMQALRAKYGLDQPIVVRYFRWISSLSHGELGYSVSYNEPALQLLLPRVRNTLLLTLPALLISWFIGVPLGVLAAARRGGWLDRIFAAGNGLLLALPDVLLCLIALLIALKTQKFPAGGMGSPELSDAAALSQVKDLLWHLWLPVGVLVIGALAPIMLHVRSSVADVMDSSYFRACGRAWIAIFYFAVPARAACRGEPSDLALWTVDRFPAEYIAGCGGDSELAGDWSHAAGSRDGARSLRGAWICGVQHAVSCGRQLSGGHSAVRL